MSGVTVIELVVCCLILAVVGGIGMTTLRPGSGTGNAGACLAPLESFLAHARARASLAAEETRVTFDTARNEAHASWREPPLRLGRGCALLAAGFGVAGRRLPIAVFYPSGSASPGHVLIGHREGSCRLTIGIRGGKARRCLP